MIPKPLSHLTHACLLMLEAISKSLDKDDSFSLYMQLKISVDILENDADKDYRSNAVFLNILYIHGKKANDVEESIFFSQL